MNPFTNTISFESKKANHFYAVKNEKGEFLKIENPEIGQQVYEIPSLSGGSSIPGEKPRLILQIPIPLCQEHFDSHNGEKFGVTTCKGWNYIAIPTTLGSTVCRECKNALFLPMPFLGYADLSSADLRYANLYSANLSSADLSSANLRSANLRSANLSLANLSLADLRSADLGYADLSSADLGYADLSSANLSSADLSSADLGYADLSSANLSSADLYSANLSSANLHSANLGYADLRYARNINDSFNLKEAYWNKFTRIDEEFKKLLSKERFIK
jgi:hypothetical protein